jgi:MFS family permease
MRARLFTDENRRWWTLVVKLADLLGRRRIFIAGLVVFTAASLWCGLAGSAARE